MIADEATRRAVYEGNARRVLPSTRRKPQDLPWGLRSWRAAAAPIQFGMRDQPKTFEQCLRELAAAIARSERWIAGMEAELAELQRRSPRVS